MTDLSIIVLSYNTKDLTIKCLRSIFSSKPKLKLEVLVVDNGSSDKTADAVKKFFPQVRLIESKVNLGFTKGNNLALKRAKSNYVLLLNSDTLVKVESLDKILNFTKKNNFDITSCKLVSTDGSFQPNAGELPAFLPVFFWLSGFDDLFKKVTSISSYQANNKKYYQNGKNVGWVSGSVMLIKKDVFKKIGFLDEKIFMYGEDVEFCLRAKKAGFKIGWTDEAEIVHLGGGSSESPKLKQWTGEFNGLLYIYQKYYGFLAALILRFLFYIFILVRIISFLILKKVSYAKTYAKVIIKI